MLTCERRNLRQTTAGDCRASRRSRGSRGGASCWVAGRVREPVMIRSMLLRRPIALYYHVYLVAIIRITPASTKIRGRCSSNRITSYNVCYTKLLRYVLYARGAVGLGDGVEASRAGSLVGRGRITSYNVCYTKLLRYAPSPALAGCLIPSTPSERIAAAFHWQSSLVGDLRCALRVGNPAHSAG